MELIVNIIINYLDDGDYIKIAICDDEKKFLNKVKKLIVSNYAANDKLTICEFESGEQFLSHFKANQYDVIILDIKMKELTGLDVAEKIRETDKSVIIAFLTSHQEFAPNGYEVNAFRYLLKGQPEHMYIKQLRSIFNEYHQRHMTIPVQMSNTVFNVAVSDISTTAKTAVRFSYLCVNSRMMFTVTLRHTLISAQQIMFRITAQDR